MKRMLGIAIGLIGMMVAPAVGLGQTTRSAGGYFLYVPGISGYRSIDREMLIGLRAGGVTDAMEYYDWTLGDAGIKALYAAKRNQVEAREVAKIIEAHFRDAPQTPIQMTTHSGGGGIGVWALEQLSPDVKIDTLIMLAPALSPGYDLTDALKHVRGRCYVFYSSLDPVLGAGTWAFGTIDGIHAEAAGKVGFERPAGGDVGEYEKVVQIPYDPAWIRYGHWGDHIGMMCSAFSEAVIAPLLTGGPVAATRPVAAPQSW